MKHATYKVNKELRNNSDAVSVFEVIWSPLLCRHTMASENAYSKMMADARKAAKKTAQEKKTKIVCQKHNETQGK